MAGMTNRTTYRFSGVTLHDDRIESRQGGGPIAGARATVDSAGQLTSRITASRLILTGPFALAFRKKNDNRELYLLVEGQGWAITVPVNPKKGKQAREFAARINAAASAIVPVAPGLIPQAPPAPAPEPPPAPATPEPPDVLEQIRKLAELRDAGALTDEEFNAKKSDLLGRL